MYLEKSRGMIRLNSLESPFCIEMRGRLAGAQRPAGSWRPHPGREPAGGVPRLLPKRNWATLLFRSRSRLHWLDLRVVRFDEGLSQWVWNPGIYKLRAGRSSRDLRVNTQVVLRW